MDGLVHYQEPSKLFLFYLFLLSFNTWYEIISISVDKQFKIHADAFLGIVSCGKKKKIFKAMWLLGFTNRKQWQKMLCTAIDTDQGVNLSLLVLKPGALASHCDPSDFSGRALQFIPVLSVL